MDAIGNNENNPVIRAYSKANQSVVKQSTVPSNSATNVQLSDLDAVGHKASKAGSEIRPEAVERGKALLADPNWPNDKTLEGLAERLLSTDDFAS